MRRFKDCFSLWPTVSFPTPVCGLAKEEVLIETFEDGVSISNYLMEPAATEAMDRAIQKAKAEANGGRKGGGGADAAASRVDEITRTAAEQNAAAAAMATFVPEENSVLAALGVKTLLKMLIDDNFLHADLHPGNILVRLPGGMRGGMPGGAKDAKEGRAMDDDDAKKDASSERNGGNGNGKAATKGAGRLPKGGRPEIIILDTGLATELTPHHQASLAEFFQSIIDWDGVGVANNIISFSSNLSPTLDTEGFRRDISAAVSQFSESSPRAGDCMNAIFETVQKYHVTIDPNVMVAVVTVMVLEGWQFRLDPSINIMDHIAEVMRSSFRKHQRLTMVDHALRDMWAPFSEPCGLSLDRSGRSPLSAQMEHGHGGGWAV